MKILIQFSNQDKKSEIITPFIGLDNCQANDIELTVPGLIKMSYGKETIECFCLGLDVAEKILSSVCNIQLDTHNNNGFISFPKSLTNVMLESRILDFQKVLELASNGSVQYVNTEKKALKAIVPLSQWLSADLSINDSKAYINFKFNNYEINVSDGSAMQFCSRVKQHPLISAASLGNYFDFGSEIKLKPTIDYLCFWKSLKSDNGYKKYSNFINECNDRIKVIYDEGKKYRCEFNGGKVDFQLLSIGDKYPKKVILQFEQLNDIPTIESLQRCLGFKTIELVGRISNLRLSTYKLLKDLKFYKDDNFFIFSNVIDNFRAEYDIGSGILTIRQEFHISDKLDKDYFEKCLKNTKEWVDVILQNIE
jgi:hypothetical protein